MSVKVKWEAGPSAFKSPVEPDPSLGFRKQAAKNILAGSVALNYPIVIPLQAGHPIIH